MAGAETESYNAFQGCVDFSRVLAIEILPSNFPAFSSLEECSPSSILVDDTSIGVPKKVLARAFITARHNLCGFLDASRPVVDINDTLFATFVILLFNPEHLTAANFRKRMLLEGWKNMTGGSRGRLMLQAIRRELVVIETLLTSPLHRHTKSPTLWYHRRWVLRHFFKYLRWDEETHGSYDANWLWQHVYRLELLMAMKAGEHHPRNYYAWSYARWLFENFRAGTDRAALSSSLIDSMELVQEWCLKHQSDTSGWSFLHFLYIQASKEVGLQGLVAPSAERVLCLALSFDWDFESIWAFLRTVMASPSLLSEKQRLALVKRIREKIEETGKVEVGSECKPSVHFLQSALVWIDLYGRGEK
ncbi:hypothetical protein FGG08_001860 [Glutinoglossum americanum]|uniref:Protein prenyltransferase alpha subunit repeat-containing protein 1 n=1 Tax=Glutinoglossum americanum TaxID=1670608 RepID=A0A9P8I7C7_9PEZI|nr:hypothetical protein FGG08_001860 [Glutinoglossum americanum]